MNRLELTTLCAQLFYNLITLPTTIIQQSVGLLLKNEVMITAENTIKKKKAVDSFNDQHGGIRHMLTTEKSFDFTLSIRIIILVSLVLNLLTISQASQASALSCDDDNAALIGTLFEEMDGFFVGSNGCAYDPALFNVEDIAAVEPTNGVTPEITTPIFVVNGGFATLDELINRLQATADAKQRPVIGIYNAHLDLLGEFLKLFDLINPSATTFRNEAFEQISNGHRVTLHGISQAGFIISRSLIQLKFIIWLYNPFSESRRNELIDLLDVEVVGGLGVYFPDGPRYVHYVNERDWLPYLSGIMIPNAHPGKGAVIATFNYRNEDCSDDPGSLLWEDYPGTNGSFDAGNHVFGTDVHSICAYSVTDYPYEALRDFAPEVGYATVPLELELGLEFKL